MADPILPTEKPTFGFEQKNAPVTPPQESTSIVAGLEPTAAIPAASITSSIPQTNGDPLAQSHHLGLHPGLKTEVVSDSAAVPLADTGLEAPTASLEKPVEGVAQGIQPVAPFVPEERENPTEAEVPDATATTTVPPAIDQPTSSIRDEPTDQPPVLDSGIPHAKEEIVADAPSSDALPQDPAPAVPTETAQPTDAVAEPATVTDAIPSVVSSVEPIPAAAPIEEKAIEQAAAEPAVVAEIAAPAADAAPSVPVVESAPAPVVPATEDTEMADAPAEPTATQASAANGVVRAREDDEAEEPAAKRTKTEGQPSAETDADFKKPELPPLATDSLAAPADASLDTPATAVSAAGEPESIDAGPVSPEQKKYLVELIRRVKKTKDALAFLAPVDPVALNLPHYFDVVKEPMDIGTMESKLKAGTYDSVDSMIRDIYLMAENSRAFNGAEHPVTFSGANTRNYLMKSIRTQLPRKGATPAPAAPKPAKEKTAAATRQAQPRRESRTAVAQSPTGNARSPGADAGTYALQPNGTPLIRRDSTATDGRPKREIHRPQPKDLPYQSARPKKKKHQTELKFCEFVMKDLMKKDHSAYAWPFYDPVDPVALNIPNYHKVIKKPMDLGTVQSNLKNGLYSNGKEFKTDVELIFGNCYKFNPDTDNVYQMGKQLEEAFKKLWEQKDDWIREHSTPETRSDEEDEDDEDEEEEEEEEEATGGSIDATRLAAIQAQINALSAEMTHLVSGASAGNRKSPTAKPSKKGKKSGDAAASKKTKRSASTAAVAAPAGKAAKEKKTVKKVPKLSQEQKREVSEGIGLLDDAGMRKAVQIIRNGVPALQNVNDDELELDIDEIPEAVVYDLYKFVRSLRPKSTTANATAPSAASDAALDDDNYAQEPDDDDFVPPARARGSTAGGAGPGRKKNKPMTATAQEAKIQELQDKLQAFQKQDGGAAGGAAGGGGEAVTGSATPDEDDEDDDAEGSSSEEE